MPVEIERKFLVDRRKWELILKPSPCHIVQGYLFNAGNKSCRIRIVNHSKAILNIKQAIDSLHRHEFEVQISVEDAKLLLTNMAEGFVEKERFDFLQGNLKWEVDVFDGDNKGLIVAEIELPNADICFEKPDWIAEEITHDKRYLNSNLAYNSFKNW